MATLPPLDYDLSGLDQFRTGARAAGVANSASDELALQRVLAASRARAAAAAAAAQSAAAPAAAQAASPAAVVADNPAPLATAEAVSAPSFGARALRLAGRAALPIGAFFTGLDAGKFLTPDKVAVGAADALGSLGKMLGIDSLGQYAGGAQQYANAQGVPDPTKIASTAPVAAAPAAASSPALDPNITRLPAGPLTDAVNSTIFDGTGVPARGSGYIRNESTGAVTALNSGPMRIVTPGQPPAVEAAPVAPHLGTQGGIFSNLANYTNDFGQYALSQAQAGRGAKLGIKAGELDVKRTDSLANRESQRQNAASNQVKAYADLLKEMTAANKPDVKVLPDLTGTGAIIVDTRAGTAKKVTASEKPTFEKFLPEARKANPSYTDAQLKAEWQRRYGG